MNKIIKFFNETKIEDIEDNFFNILYNNKYCTTLLGEGSQSRVVKHKINKYMKIKTSSNSKIKIPIVFYDRFIDRYELRSVPEDKVYNSPVLSGCFTLLNLKAIKEIGMFDDKYFMYFEDWDLSRRMHKVYKTLYYPKVAVYHGYNSGANKNIKLFFIFIKSAVYYFKKWGWFFDKERKTVNKNALLQFNK